MVPVCGVYMLFRQRKLIYVGHSADCHATIRTHRIAGRLFDYATVTPTAEADAAWIETAIVGAMQPADASNEAAPKPVERQGRPMPSRLRAAPPSALTALSKEQAVTFARKAGLSQALLAAWGDRALPLFPKHAGRNGPGAPMQITYGDLTAWCEVRQLERTAAA